MIKKKFKDFENKIEYLVIDHFPNDFSSWQRENYQRNYISEGLKNAKDDDYIIISDVDEIPNLRNINNLNEHNYTAFKQKNLSFKLNLICIISNKNIKN